MKLIAIALLFSAAAFAQCGKLVLNPVTGDLSCSGNLVTGVFTARGVWAGGTTYAALDLVALSGVTYISLQSSNTNHSPDVSPTFWAVPAPTGAQGAQGVQGVQGVAGNGSGDMIAATYD